MSEEAGQRVLLDGLDFTTQFGEGLAANLAKNFGVAPLAMQAAGTESSLEDAAFVGKQAQGILNHRGVEGKTIRSLALGEWAVGAGVTTNQFKHGLRDVLHQAGGQAGRKRDSESIAVTRRVFCGNEAAGMFATWGDADFEQAARTEKPVERIEQR